jgi:hypothetical protein
MELLLDILNTARETLKYDIRRKNVIYNRPMMMLKDMDKFSDDISKVNKVRDMLYVDFIKYNHSTIYGIEYLNLATISAKIVKYSVEILIDNLEKIRCYWKI